MTMIQSVWPSMKIQPAIVVKKVKKIRIKHKRSSEEGKRCINDEKI